MNLKVIIFDFDGVIHDTFELVQGLMAETVGDGLTKKEFRDLSDGNVHDHDRISKKHIAQYFQKQSVAYDYLNLEENIKGFLEDMNKHYSLFIISSNQETAIDAYFYNNNFTHIFEEVLGVETHTSKVEKFRQIFATYQFTADECVFVTDTLGDIREGNKVGVRTIAVDFGFHERKRLEKGNPFKIVSSFDELRNVIGRL